MGCKYVKDFKFDSANGYTGSTGKTEVKAYMRGGVVRKAPLDAKVPKQTPNDMRPLRTANAKTAMKDGGEAKSTVNAAGNYTKPDLRKRIFNSIKAAAVQGTGAGESRRETVCKAA